MNRSNVPLRNLKGTYDMNGSRQGVQGPGCRIYPELYMPFLLRQTHLHTGARLVCPDNGRSHIVSSTQGRPLACLQVVNCISVKLSVLSAIYSRGLFVCVSL